MFLLILGIALVIWLGLIIHAKVRHQEVPWKRVERRPTTPLGRALRGIGAQLPEATPQQRSRNLKVVAGLYGAMLLVAGVAVAATWTTTHDGGAAIAAGIGGFVLVSVVGFIVAAIAESRPRR